MKWSALVLLATPCGRVGFDGAAGRNAGGQQGVSANGANIERCP
ncbi:MAG TPA: hypothetical protein VGM90_39285 [Kofleriaceae bacterium]